MRRPSGLTATQFTAILMPGEPVDWHAGSEVPDHHGVVLGPRDDASPVGAHRHAPHPILMPDESVALGAGFEVPDRYGLVFRQAETMRRPSGLTATTIHRTLMPREPVDRRAGFEVPDHHGFVLGPGDDASPVGAHRHGSDRACRCPAQEFATRAGGIHSGFANEGSARGKQGR